MNNAQLLMQYEQAPIIEPRHLYAFKKLESEIQVLYNALPKDLTVHFVSGQPYESAQAMWNVFETRVLLISSDYCNHPVWDESTNMKFRAIHDYYGHILTRFDFSLEGEYNAYLAGKRLHSDSAAHALFTEVYVQALWAITYGEFPVQKAVLL